MTLPALTWRKLPEATPASTAVADYLAAIQTAFGSATYQDGSARTAGSGIAWSVAATAGTPLEAVHLAPPSGSGCSAAVVFAGYAGAKTPGMASPDTWLASALLALVSSNGGTLGTWDGATPLGASARITGYTKVSPATTAGAAGVLRCYESKEAIAVFLRVGTNAHGILVGALWEPLSADLLDAESDGRLYGYLTGGTATISTTFESNTSQSWSGIHGGSDGNAHGQWLAPGTSTLRVAQRMHTLAAAATSATRKGYSGSYWLQPSWYYSTAAGAENMVGELRGVRRGPRNRLGQKYSAAGVVKAYMVGGSDSTDVDVLYLLY